MFLELFLAVDFVSSVDKYVPVQMVQFTDLVLIWDHSYQVT